MLHARRTKACIDAVAKAEGCLHLVGAPSAPRCPATSARAPAMAVRKSSGPINSPKLSLSGPLPAALLMLLARDERKDADARRLL